MNTVSYIAVLGNTPDLSALELDRLGITSPDAWQGGNTAKLAASIDIELLGGTVKIAEYLGTIPRSLDGVDQLFELLVTNSANKIHFGFSMCAGDASINNAVLKTYRKQFEQIGLRWKKSLRDEHKRSVRLVTSQDVALSSVIVHKEKLLDQKTDFVISIYKKEIILARTISVQDYKDYAERDYGRPEVDPRSGMLPPKVAKMLVNIAAGNARDGVVLDPFCGSGTVLLEALNLGHTQVIGSDSSTKAIEDSEANVAWLANNAAEHSDTHIDVSQVKLYVSEVQKIADVLPAHSVKYVAGEGYLGPVSPKKTDKVVRQMEKLYTETFAALPAILEPGAQVVLAVPSWQRHDRLQTMELDEVIAKHGFTQFHEPIFYGREGARVVRQIWFLERI